MRNCPRILAIMLILLIVSTSSGDITRSGDAETPELCLSQRIRGQSVAVPIYYTRNVSGALWFRVGPFDLHTPVSVETGDCRKPNRPVVTASAGG